jgi:hypothetical protein
MTACRPASSLRVHRRDWMLRKTRSQTNCRPASDDGKRGKRLEVAQPMSWDRRGYYYRVRKVNGRVVREYVGAGRVAELVAQMDDTAVATRSDSPSRRRNGHSFRPVVLFAGTRADGCGTIDGKE